MNGEYKGKIKTLLDAVPPGALVDSKWMNRHNIADSTYHDYVRRGWLLRLAQGLFLRPSSAMKRGDPLLWRVVVASMHQIMELDFHVGGISALNLQGFAHFVQMSGKDRVLLYATRLPGWLDAINTDATFERRSIKLFNDPYLGIQALERDGPTFAGPASFPLSTPERGVLEAMDELSEDSDFYELDRVFEGLVNLRPSLLMGLLQDCRKVKVVRLFFAFGERHRHAWFPYLDEHALNFGSGDRQLVKSGRIHPKYRITVPAWFMEASAD